MAEQENLRISRETWDAWNAHDPDRYLKNLDDRYVAESDTIPDLVSGHAAVREFMMMYVGAFPDLSFTIDQMLASGDFVVTRWTATGTHGGALMGIPPTNRTSVTHGCTVTEFKNGKQVHDWIYWDVANMLRQLGVMPGPR
jgi:steroid delta-isomerase-like uncharacterized protein